MTTNEKWAGPWLHGPDAPENAPPGALRPPASPSLRQCSSAVEHDNKNDRRKQMFPTFCPMMLPYVCLADLKWETSTYETGLRHGQGENSNGAAANNQVYPLILPPPWIYTYSLISSTKPSRGQI
uniref:Uncharacterized protein n=1 Tax=Salvator merianae TaxID=96440 RepID=A0A8D0BLA9_SALMN